MRKKSVLIISWLLGGFLLAGLGACSGDDDSSVTKDHQQTDVVKLRRLTITETEDDVASQAGATRAILKEKDGLSASWMAGDGLTYCNLSRSKDMNGGIYSGALTASSTARISQFTGNVTCIRGDYLAVVYPATTFVTNDSYSISLCGQDGTLGTLASTFHYVYGKAHVESVTDETANATMMKMMFPYAKEFVCLTPVSERALPAHKLAKFFKDHGHDAVYCKTYENGIKRAIKMAGKDGTVVAFGSLYMAGNLRTVYSELYGK